jgi:hypothetical protein
MTGDGGRVKSSAPFAPDCRSNQVFYLPAELGGEKRAARQLPKRQKNVRDRGR